MNKITPELWETIGQIEAAQLDAQRLKALTAAFAELFTIHTPEINAKAVASSAEQFSDFFSVIDVYAEKLNDAINAACAACYAAAKGKAGDEITA